MVTEITAKGIGKKPGTIYHLWQYDSLREVADDAKSCEVKFKSARTGDKHYNLTASFDEAYELAVHGWHDIRSKVDAHLEPLREQLGQVLGVDTMRVLDMVGVEPDIDRYLDGELECMWDDMMVESPKTGKVFTLLVDASMTFDNEASEIAKRGATLCALTEAFILLGFQLEVWVEVTQSGYDKRDELSTRLVRVQTAGDPIDVDAMMFAIGHPDFFRRILWAQGEKYPIMRDSFGYNEHGYYGLNREGAHMYDRVGASLIVSLDGNRELTADPLKWILDQLEIQGIYEGGE